MSVSASPGHCTEGRPGRDRQRPTTNASGRGRESDGDGAPDAVACDARIYRSRIQIHWGAILTCRSVSPTTSKVSTGNSAFGTGFSMIIQRPLRR